MKIELEITDAQAEAVTMVANTAGETDVQAYLQTRFSEVCESYVQQIRTTEHQAVITKLEKLNDADRAEILAAVEAKPEKK